MSNTTTAATLDDRPAEDLTPRARIRDAAMAEFADHGYHGATMRGIAAAAGVSLGLVQHYYGTKDDLRAACDERVLQVIEFKMRALDDGRLGQADVLGTLMAMAPPVQRYVGRALVDGSSRIAELVDRMTDSGEEFLTSWWPDRFDRGSQRTRDAAAVVIAISTSTMVLQDHLARQLQVEPFSEAAMQRVGMAMFDAFEAFGDFVQTDTWAQMRAGMAAQADHSSRTTAGTET